MSQITPPVGLNLFVIQALTGRDLLYLAGAALPFFVVMVIMVGLLIAFPEMATFLLQQMTRGCNDGECDVVQPPSALRAVPRPPQAGAVPRQPAHGIPGHEHRLLAVPQSDAARRAATPRRPA